MGKNWLIALVVWLPVALVAQNSRPRIEKEPSWVTVRTLNYDDKKLDKQAESGFVNIDFEKQVSLQQQAIYCRRAIRIISESGVQNSSEVNIDYDPAYSQLVFH